MCPCEWDKIPSVREVRSLAGGWDGIHSGFEVNPTIPLPTAHPTSSNIQPLVIRSVTQHSNTPPALSALDIHPPPLPLHVIHSFPPFIVAVSARRTGVLMLVLKFSLVAEAGRISTHDVGLGPGPQYSVFRIRRAPTRFRGRALDFSFAGARCGALA